MHRHIYRDISTPKAALRLIFPGYKYYYINNLGGIWNLNMLILNEFGKIRANVWVGGTGLNAIFCRHSYVHAQRFGDFAVSLNVK
jgi:hypothetical protein